MICLGQLLCLSLRFHAERAIDIITHILPEDHLLLASSKRVKGKASFLEMLDFCPLCGGSSGEYETQPFYLKTSLTECRLGKFHYPCAIYVCMYVFTHTHTHILA